MRTNIEIDDALMSAVLSETPAKTKREAVELGLQALLRLQREVAVSDLFGKLTWEGDLHAMRLD